MSNINYGMQVGGNARIEAGNLAAGYGAQANQYGAGAADVAGQLDEVLRLIEAHRAALDEPDLARAEVEMAKTELAAKQPKADRVLAALKRAGEHVGAVGVLAAALKTAAVAVAALL
ncbi:hypothetical protein [Paractinoplanes durhamensis]|uniref:Uncharacterized protein n=1 Tax=Paractinoplanes durhamensis TaxID=113563 RepID=A0ABQ3YR46_9ACTN|nr:hypothetical protein [Actinoplanes durhamensis]GID99994.1 hypothetical protein Adu01nite_13450 [Actinoplanes durhamensis]